MNRKLLFAAILSPRPHRSLAHNLGQALFSIPHNPATRFNKSRRATSCIRQPCKRRGM